MVSWKIVHQLDGAVVCPCFPQLQCFQPKSIPTDSMDEVSINIFDQKYLASLC